MQHFPIFLDLKGRFVAIYGNDQAAAAKARLLSELSSQVCVITNELSDELRALSNSGKVTWLARQFEASQIEGAALVIVSPVHQEMAAISRAARLCGVPVNVVDRPAQSTFLFPAVVERGDLVVAISTGGKAPVLAQGMRARIEALLPAAAGEWIRVGEQLRRRINAILPMGARRRDFWRRSFFGGLADELLAKPEAAQAALTDALAGETRRSARVSVIGVDPDDIQHMSLKAAAALFDADVVIVDGVDADSIRHLTRREARLIEKRKAGQVSYSRCIDPVADLERELAPDRHVVLALDVDTLALGAWEEVDLGPDIDVAVLPSATGAAGGLIAHAAPGEAADWRLAS